MRIATKYKGETTEGRDFYDLLYESKEFNEQLGKVTLAAGRLEAELTLLLISKGLLEKPNQQTLGQLINSCKKNELLSENLISTLERICFQRNYLTHNIFALLTELIEETILEGRELIDTDVTTYTDRAWQLQKNLSGLADLICEYNIT